MLKQLSSKGQLVLPASYRRKFGLSAGSSIRISEDGDRLILEPAEKNDAVFVKVEGYSRPILSIGKNRKITDADLVDPLDDDA